MLGGVDAGNENQDTLLDVESEAMVDASVTSLVCNLPLDNLVTIKQEPTTFDGSNISNSILEVEESDTIISEDPFNTSFIPGNLGRYVLCWLGLHSRSQLIT